MEKLLNAILYFLLLMAVDCWRFDEDPVTVPNAPVTARVGESVILPCHLSAEISAVEKEVRWYRVRNNKFSIVLNYATKKSIPEMQNEEYSDRVSFFIQEMEKGNASLQMKNTAFSDEGEYKCCVISDNLHCKIVKLLVPVGLNITENVNAILGTRIILPCYLDAKVSAEDLELRWQKDGLATSVLLYKNKKVVTVEQHEDYRERVRLHTDLRKGDLSLVIEDVRIADEGKYTCFVKAVTQENEGSVYLSVNVRLKSFPDKISATMGQNTAIPCHLNPEVSALDLEVRWQKEGLEAPVLLYKNRREEQHEQYRGRARLHSDLTKGDLSLILESVRDVDVGRYTCHVRTLSQVNESTLYLSITAHGRKPVITVHKQPGGEIRLKCESKGWYPKPELHWNYGDGSVIPVHPDFSEKVEEDGRITVTSYLSVQDSYEEDFLCIVQLNDSKEKFVSTFHVSVKLKTSESMCLSEINKNVILPCHLNPAVRVLDSEVKWEKKGLTSPVFLYTNRRVALEEHHEQYKERTQLNSQDKRTGDLSLSLKNVKVTDEGRYTCSVKAHGREIQASLDLSVTAQGGKPVITVDEEPGNVKLKCISRGWYPKPQLKWTHEDGSAVTEYSELFEEVEDDGQITITSYLSIRDQYDKKILCCVQLIGSKERAVSSIIISRGRPQNFTHLVALICVILVLCYIIMCKKGYAQIKSIFLNCLLKIFLLSSFFTYSVKVSLKFYLLWLLLKLIYS